MSLANALDLTQQILALGLALQSLELLFLRKQYSDSGAWSWQNLKGDLSAIPKPLKSAADCLMGEKVFFNIILLRLCFSLVLLFYSTPALLLFLLFSTLLISLRWRGTFNGGSDYMSLILLLALTVASLSDSSSVKTGALCYIAIQSCISYFRAGLAKFKERDWINGTALPIFTQSGIYGATPALGALFKIRPLGLVLSYGVILFELAFPLALLNSKLALVFIGGGALFHFSNALVFGLNRFFLAWLATYPALYFCSGWISSLK